LSDIPKHSACCAFSEFSQSLRAAPDNPAQALDGVAVAVGGGVVVAGAVAAVDDSVAVCACANNGMTAISDNAHAIALVFQRFIDPPFAKPNMLRCQAHAYRSAFVTPLLLGPPSDD